MIDERAVVDPSARIADDVHVGPYTVIGADVQIGEGTWVGPHVVLQGPTTIGRRNQIYQFASVGEVPQDKKYRGEKTHLEIGDDNVIRECCTINRGTVQGGGVTRVGDDNWIMAYVHIAHDCIIGDHTVFANNSSLAGHVVVEDYAILGGFTLVHQFCNIGAYAFTGKASGIVKDVPPYVRVSGPAAKPYGLNSEGLKRHGFPAQTLTCLRRAYKIVYRSNLTVKRAVDELRELARESAEVARLADFIEKSSRGIVR
ncbi:MAG TPA: acyl-ACP--UDP-N-acetylglucosamine O-acyltransferase [Gammaproteobacteria bacterium]|nr:acyl-ACP--UDP-N-acetylglucosamine O-acyltransferase [Gammaproteobacteria bacterium]